MNNEKLIVASHKIGTADSYTFTFNNGAASTWAIFTVNNSTGEFAIRSDYGGWSYRWSIRSLGEKHEMHEKPLAHFLASGTDSHYIVDKLGYDFTQDLKPVRRKPSPTAIFLTEQLIPFFQNFLRTEILKTGMEVPK